MVRVAPLPAALLLSLVCCLSSTASAARLGCHISDISPAARSLRVACTLDDFSPPASGKLELRFRTRFAGVERLSDRVFALRFAGAEQRPLPLPEITDAGVYRVRLDGAQSVGFSYELRLSRALDPGQYALVSSLGPEVGFVLLSDALPQVRVLDPSGSPQPLPPVAVRLQLTPPDGWEVATTEARRGESYEVADAEQSVFFLGRLRRQTRRVGEMELHTAVAGTWSFPDAEAVRLTEAIAREQAAMIGSQEEGNFLVTLAPFPLPLTGLRSTALTRGRTVILMLNPDGGSDGAARALKHFQKHLAHETFHFYLPGAFRARENFDWFWEGFTRYTALVTLLRLKLMDARDYLDALGEEYEAYAANPARLGTSLIEASAGKFASRENYDLVYRKGTLVAALYDLSLRWQSGGKKSVADVTRALYHNYARAGREVGNQEVINELSRAGDFKRFISDYITGTREIDLAASLKPYGWAVEQSAATRGRVRVNVAPKLSDKQRVLLTNLSP
jgi:predicted metalloprotease with PDZ domain